MKLPEDVPHELNEADFFRRGAIAEHFPALELDFRIERDRTEEDRKSDDRFLLCFFGACVVMIGLASIVPAVWQWIMISRSDDFQGIPRWVYLLGFSGGLHVCYALFVSQIGDYSALQSLAVFLLVATCVYGFVGIALWLGDNEQFAVRFIQISAVLKPRAAIWCGIMFSVSALGCFLFGREAVVWRRRACRRSR